MDMAPAQAPPALIQNESHQAVQAFSALLATHGWMLDERRDMPAAADAVDDAHRQAFLNALDHFWAGTAHASANVRRAAWADKIADTMKQLATLRERDGTLDPQAAQLARRVTATRGAGIPGDLQVGELLIGDTPYAGTLVALDHRMPGVVVLFTPDQGWDVFATLDDAHASVQEHVRRMHAEGIDPQGVTRRALHDIIHTSFVSSRPVAQGDAFEALVTRAIQLQREKLAEAWVTHTASERDGHRDVALVDAIDSALQPHALVDIDTILARRDQRLVAAVQAARLAGVPATVSRDWEDAWTSHQTSLGDLADTSDDATIPDAMAYADAQLRSRLEGLGVTTPPADIVVTLDRSRDPGARFESLQGLFEGPAPARMHLIDLAWQNIAVFDHATLSAADAKGAPITTLGNAHLRALVRDLDLPWRYADLLTTQLRDGEAAQQRRGRALALQHTWMRVQANEARLSYYLPGEPASLRPDRAERGYRWIEAVLDAPSAEARRQVEGHDIVVRQVTYRGVALADVVEIGTASTASVPTILLYTPDAPDGIAWREFDDREDAGRRFFYHPAFREYILDRLPAEFAKTGANGQSRAFDIDGRSWVFRGAESAGYTQTGEPFVERDVGSNFLEARYATALELALRNVASFGRSASQANWSWLVDPSRRWSTVVNQAVTSAIAAPFRAPGAAWRFYDSVKGGDSAQAFVDFTELYTHSLALLPYTTLGRLHGAVPALPVGAVARHARFRSGPSSIHSTSIRPPRAALDARYLARNVRKEGTSNAQGLYTVEGQTYLEHDGAMYAARWDASFDIVRLRRPDSATTSFGPAVQRAADGHWAPVGVGLKGGSGRTLLQRLLGHESPPAAQNALDDWQRSAFGRNLDFELYSRMPNTASRHDLLRQVEEGVLMGRAPALSEEHALVWAEASRAAHENVTRPPVIVASGTTPLDLSVRRPPVAQAPAAQVPPGYRLISPSAMPAHLYLVDRLPYRRSAFQRELRQTQRSGSGYDNQSALLRPSTHAQGVSGVRLTTLGPMAPGSQLRAVTGLTATRSMFLVRLDTAQLAPRMTLPGARLQLLEVEGSGGTSYVLRTLDSRPIIVTGNEFSPPVIWQGL